MWLYLARRVALAVATLLLAVTAIFVMIRVVPGDPATIILGQRATPAQIAALDERMGLDKPLPVQVVRYYRNLVSGDMGEDAVTHRPVSRVVFGRLPYTLILIFAAIAWAIVLAVPLGCYSAVKRGSIVDRVMGVLSVSTIAIPSFVIALYILLFFAVYLRWLPAIGVGSGGVLDRIRHLILPALAIGIGWVGYLARMVRASMLEVLGESHVRMTRAFGLSETRIVLRYALPIAILPTITLLGVGIAYLLSAAVFTEVIFARPGIGSLIVEAVQSRNYPVVMGCVVVTTGLFVVTTMLADFANALLDPRVRDSL